MFLLISSEMISICGRNSGKSYVFRPDLPRVTIFGLILVYLVHNLSRIMRLFGSILAYVWTFLDIIWVIFAMSRAYFGPTLIFAMPKRVYDLGYCPHLFPGVHMWFVLPFVAPWVGVFVQYVYIIYLRILLF